MLDQANLKNKAGVEVIPVSAWNHPYDAKTCDKCGQTIAPAVIQGVHWRQDGTAVVYNSKDEEVAKYNGTHAETLKKLAADGIEWNRLPFTVGKPAQKA